MSHGKIGWAFSAERPVAVQSPSMMPLSDIQTRLNFSMSKSPSSNQKKKPLITISKTPRTPLSNGSTPQMSVNTRIADYHMSKQNPDVLDRIYSSTTPQNGYTPFGSRQTTTSPLYGSGHSSTNSSPGFTFQNQVSHTPVQMSLLRQTLNASKSRSVSRSSLVQLATQRSSVRLNSGASISPVVVRLSRGTDTPSSKGVRSEESVSRLVNGVSDGHAQVGNPCNKDTVLSALRNKRKRWACNALDESSSSISLASCQPSAKRSKQGTQNAVSPPTGRKRPHEPVTTTQSSDTNKRSKVAKPIPRRVNRIRMPEIEYEPETEPAQCDDVSNKMEVVAAPPVNTQTVVNESREKEGSPQLMSVNEEIVKKREDSLSKLRTVFPSAKSEKSLRREVPVFCATGQKPHMPSPLSSTYTATREDLLKDREAAAEKLNQFLANNDEVKPAPSTSATSKNSTGLKSNLETILEQSSMNSVPTSPVATTVLATDSVKDGLKLSSVSGKSVSFASPIASSIPSTTTTVSSLSTAGVSSTTSTGLTLPQIGLQTSFGSSKTEPAGVTQIELQTSSKTAPSLKTTKTSGGGLSLGSLATPPLSTASTDTASQATVVSLAQATTSNTLLLGAGTATISGSAGISSNALTFGTAVTPCTGPQSSTVPTATTAPLGTNTAQSLFGSNSTQANIPASGLQFGAQNTTVPSSDSGLSVTQPSGGLMFGNVTASTAAAQKPTFSFGVNTTSSSSTTTTQTSQNSNSTKLPSISLTPANTGLSFGTQQQAPLGISSQGGGLSLGNNSLGSGALNGQQPSGGLLFGNTATTSATSTLKSTGGLTTSTTAQQSTTGLLFGNKASSADNKQPLTGGLLFGNSANSASNVQQTSGLLFGNNTNPTGNVQQSGSVLSFGNSANSAGNTQQSKSGLLFGNSADSAGTQQSNSGLSFGSSTGATQSGSGLLFGNSAASTVATQQSSGGLSFGNNAVTSSNSTQPSGGLMFGSKTTSSSGFSFTASQTTQSSIFGNQAANEAPKPTTGLLFGATSTQSTSNPTKTFSFSAGGGNQQQSMFSGGNNAQQPMTFNFGGSQPQPSTQGNSIFGGGSSGTQNQSNSMFGGALNSTTQAQSNTTSGFAFSAGTSNQKSGTGGQLNFRQTPQAGLNFGMGQSQSGTANKAFSFKPSGESGLNVGGLSNTGGMGIGGGQGLSAGTSNIFNSPQPSNTGGFQFTPQQSTPQQGFDFTATTPNQSGFNFSVATPTPNPFTVGTPGEAGSRSTSRARRRGRKK